MLNALQDVANAVGMYSIKRFDRSRRAKWPSLGADACMRLNRAVIRARRQEPQGRKRSTSATRSTPSNRKADRMQRKAITKLFDGSHSIWTAIKMREFYALQEDVLDRCEDAAKTIEEILIENS